MKQATYDASKSSSSSTSVCSAAWLNSHTRSQCLTLPHVADSHWHSATILLASQFFSRRPIPSQTISLPLSLMICLRCSFLKSCNAISSIRIEATDSGASNSGVNMKWFYTHDWRKHVKFTVKSNTDKTLTIACLSYDMDWPWLTNN